MSTFDIALLVGHIALSALNLVSICWYIWWMLDFVKHWNEEYVRKRRPRFVILTNICLTFLLLQTDPLNLAFNINGNKITSIIYDNTWLWLIFPMMSMIWSAMSIRIWLLYFDMSLSHVMKNKEWQMVRIPVS